MPRFSGKRGGGGGARGVFARVGGLNPMDTPGSMLHDNHRNTHINMKIVYVYL